jgi:outer membrane receptor protein involved in Fe transport
MYLLFSAALADESIVVAAPAGPSPGATAASLTVLPLGPDAPPGEDLAGVLDTASGTTIRRLGGLGDFAAVSLRGSTFRQVEVHLDGVPLNPDGGSAVNLSELPVSAFDRVEVYRGLAPVAFGSGAIGGVLNLVTPTRPAPASVSARLGSFGTAGVTAVVMPIWTAPGTCGSKPGRATPNPTPATPAAAAAVPAPGAAPWASETVLEGRDPATLPTPAPAPPLPDPILAPSPAADPALPTSVPSPVTNPALPTPAPCRPARVDTLLAVEQLHTNGDFPYFDDQGTEYNLFDDRTLTRENNRIDRLNLLGRVRFDTRTARFTLQESFVGSDQALPGPISAGATHARLGVLRSLLSAGVELSPAPTLGVRPQAWWAWRQETFDDRAGELGVGEQHTRDRSDTAGGQVGATWLPRPWLGTSAVLRGRYERYTPFDLLSDTADPTRARVGGVFALGADARLWGDRITLSPAFHLDLLSDDAGADALADPKLWPTPRAGLLVRPVWWLALKASAGLYLRPPDLTELYGDHGTMVGNSSLLPERGQSWEVGARAEAPWDGLLTGALDVGYARRHAQDLITWVQNSQQTQIAQNIGEASIGSLEGALTLNLGGWVSSQTNATWMVTRNRVEDPAFSGKSLPNLPELELAQQTTLRVPERIALTHAWSYTSLTFMDTANLGFTAPRDLHGLSLDVTVLPGLPTIRAEVLNLFDVRGTAVDRNPLDDGDDTRVVRPLTDFAGYPLPGRTVLVGVQWTEPRRTP